MDQPVRIIIAPPGEGEPTTKERERQDSIPADYLYRYERNQQKGQWGKKKSMNNRQHKKNAHRNNTKENSHTSNWER